MRKWITCAWLLIFFGACNKSNESTNSLSGTFEAGHSISLSLPVMYTAGGIITDTALIRSFTKRLDQAFLNTTPVYERTFYFTQTIAMPDTIRISLDGSGGGSIYFRNFFNLEPIAQPVVPFGTYPVTVVNGNTAGEQLIRIMDSSTLLTPATGNACSSLSNNFITYHPQTGGCTVLYSGSGNTNRCRYLPLLPVQLNGNSFTMPYLRVLSYNKNPQGYCAGRNFQAYNVPNLSAAASLAAQDTVVVQVGRLPFHQ